MKKLINHSQYKILKVLTSMMLALLLPRTVFSNEQNSTNAQPSEQLGPLILWYTKPADQWVEALPIGNGRLGGMVFGRIDYERIQLNE